MLFDNRIRRLARGTSLAGGVLAATAVALLGATHPTAAAAALAVLTSTVNCATTAACVIGNNTSTGPGVAGTSSKGIGVSASGKTGLSASGSTAVLAAGTTGVNATGTNGYAVKGVSSSAYGIFGSSASGGAGVVGTTPSRYGVYGYTTGSSGGYGVYGASTNGYGVYGSTTSGSGIGVYGYENGAGTGAYGFSTTGNGVEGVTSDGYGLYADAYGTGTGIYATANTGYAVIATTGGTGSGVALYGKNASGNGSDITGSYIGLLGRAPASGAYPLVLTDTSGNDLFYVDGAGNVSYHGGLFHFARVPGGATVKSFSTQTTSPTVEDTGTAQLVGGAAAVRLDPTFAASIDSTSSYRVFLTPNGDTHGLFVATKTPNGFIVRESQGGRATVSFDYRIVATAVGQAGQRMAVTNAAVGPRAPLAVLPALKATGPAHP